MTDLSASDVIVHLDDRVRTMSALLAATRYPDQAQARRPHGTHPHARATRKRVAAFVHHPAVTDVQTLLDRGAPMEALFSLALLFRAPNFSAEKLPSWSPLNFAEHVRDFYARAELARWWRDESAAWEKSRADCRAVFAGAPIKQFLAPFVGEVQEQLVFIPNIGYPCDQEIGLRFTGRLVAIIPPRLAWGDSPPWPYDEDPAHVLRAAITEYGRLLINAMLKEKPEIMPSAVQAPLPVGEIIAKRHPRWQDQLMVLLTAGMVALYLETHVSKAEAEAYVLMERKVRGMTALPAVVSVLGRYMSEKAAGRYKGLSDFLPKFPKLLRVANKIVSL